MKAAFGTEVLAAYYKRHLEANLPSKTYAILKHLVALGKPEFTQDDADGVEKYQSNRSRRFSQLEQEDAIRLLRSEGPRKVYTLGSPSRLAFASHGEPST